MPISRSITHIFHSFTPISSSLPSFTYIPTSHTPISPSLAPISPSLTPISRSLYHLPIRHSHLPLSLPSPALTPMSSPSLSLISLLPPTYSSLFPPAVEICEPRHRGTVAIVTTLPWALGTMAWGGLAYLVRSWRILNLIASLPGLLFLPCIWFVALHVYNTLPLCVWSIGICDMFSRPISFNLNIK